MFCTRARSCARADDAKIVRSRNAQCKTRESPEMHVRNHINFPPRNPRTQGLHSFDQRWETNDPGKIQFEVRK